MLLILNDITMLCHVIITSCQLPMLFQAPHSKVVQTSVIRRTI
jgi:hypothetical protein